MCAPRKALKARNKPVDFNISDLLIKSAAFTAESEEALGEDFLESEEVKTTLRGLEVAEGAARFEGARDGESLGLSNAMAL